MRAEEEHGMRFFGSGRKSNLLKTKEVVGCGWTKEGACGDEFYTRLSVASVILRSCNIRR
jgi:hypothetical protein